MTPHDPIAGRFARAVTLLITWATKLTGLASAFNQLLLKNGDHPFALGISAFMMAGAELSEKLVLAMIDRLLGDPTDSKPENQDP